MPRIQRRGSSWRWYGVKTLYRTSAVGKPRATDAFYDPALTLVEERVVLLRARSFNEAIRRAEREAAGYAKSPQYRNPYGQRVRCRYLKACDAYELPDPPGFGVEVFSRTELVSADVHDDRINDRQLGAEEKRPDPRRKNFLNELFSGRVGELLSGR